MSGGNNRCFVHHRVRSPEGFCSQALVNLLAAAVEFLLPEIVPDNPVGLGDAPGGAMFAPLTTFYERRLRNVLEFEDLRNLVIPLGPLGFQRTQKAW